MFEPLLPTHIPRERFEAAGVLFDCDLFKKQVDSVCKSCFVGCHNLQRIKDQRNWLCWQQMHSTVADWTTVIHYIRVYPKVT